MTPPPPPTHPSGLAQVSLAGQPSPAWGNDTPIPELLPTMDVRHASFSTAPVPAYALVMEFLNKLHAKFADCAVHSTQGVEGRMNFSSYVQRMNKKRAYVPGDGSCLLHAVYEGMFGSRFSSQTPDAAVQQNAYPTAESNKDCAECLWKVNMRYILASSLSPPCHATMSCVLREACTSSPVGFLLLTLLTLASCHATAAPCATSTLVA